MEESLLERIKKLISLKRDILKTKEIIDIMRTEINTAELKMEELKKEHVKLVGLENLQDVMGKNNNFELLTLNSIEVMIDNQKSIVNNNDDISEGIIITDKTEKVNDFFDIKKQKKENILYRILKDHEDENLDIKLTYKKIEKIADLKFGEKLAAVMMINKFIKNKIIIKKPKKSKKQDNVYRFVKVLDVKSS